MQLVVAMAKSSEVSGNKRGGAEKENVKKKRNGSQKNKKKVLSSATFG